MSLTVDRIRDILEDRNISIRGLGVMTGIPTATISRYIGTETQKIPLDKLELIANALKVSPSYLMGWEESPNEMLHTRIAHSLGSYSLASSVLSEIRPVEKKRLPMLGNVACGEPLFANEEHETYIEADSNLDADFCLTAKGDSMINARIFDGDILFIKSQSSVNDGEIAVILVEDEATVKRVYYDRDNNTITLVPENPTLKPLRYTGEQLDQIRILGKVLSGQYTVD